MLLCRQTLKQSFPDKLWLDIFSKSDLLTAHFQAADALRQQDADSASHSQLLPDSSPTQIGAAQRNIDSHFDDVFVAADQDASGADDEKPHNQQAGNSNHADVSHLDDHDTDNNYQADAMHPSAQHPNDDSIASPLREEQEEWGGALDPANSVQEVLQAVLTLPTALRISSVTQEGIESLQLATMQLLSNPTSSDIQQEPT